MREKDTHVTMIDIQTLSYSRGGDLGGTGGRSPQKVRWRGRMCFYPPNI